MDKEQCKLETQAHIDNVETLIFKLAAQLVDRAHNHDASKLEDPELEIFTEYTPKLATSTYGSDEYKSFLKEMKVALDHHYKENRHHPEHFKNGIKDMTLVDLIEMIADWKAATMRHNDGNIMRSIELNQERFGYSDELKAILKNTAKELIL